eukprot:5000445-Prymnesium_polylepis.2
MAPLRACAHAVLVDLCNTRKLNPASELPRLLPLIVDAQLGEATAACIGHIMRQERDRAAYPVPSHPLTLHTRLCTHVHRPHSWPAGVTLRSARVPVDFRVRAVCCGAGGPAAVAAPAPPLHRPPVPVDAAALPRRHTRARGAFDARWRAAAGASAGGRQPVTRHTAH